MEIKVTPVSKVEHSTKITVASHIDTGLSRNSNGAIVQAVPTVLITAEFRGIWDSDSERDADMQKTVEALIASYKGHTTQSKAL